jgi:hypothetical protein
MAEGTVQLPPDGAGKKLRTVELTVGANTVEQEVISLASSAGAVWDTLPVRDDYQSGEILADQTGAAGVLTFTFASAVHMVYIFANGLVTDIARADPFGGTPSATLGIPIGDEAAAYLPVTTTSVKIYAPTNMVISVAGFRRS